MPEQTALNVIILHTIDTGQVRAARLAAALSYLRRGWPVVPVRGKRPLVPWRAFQRRLPTEDELRRWLSQTPCPELAVVTGVYSGLLVLDIDGAQGEASVKGRHLPVTPMAWTPRGGRHVFFRHPGGRVPSRTGAMPGVDIRADGGLVVVPPAEGREWVDWLSPDDVPLADAPAWVLELLSADRERGGREGDTSKLYYTVYLYRSRDQAHRPASRSTDKPTDRPRAAPALLHPLTGEDLRKFYDSTEVGIAIARHLGLPTDGLLESGRGKPFSCPLHRPDRHPSASLYVHPESGAVLLRCWHGRRLREGDSDFYSLPTVAAMMARPEGDKERPPTAPEVAAWGVRLLVETGFVAPAHVEAAPLPEDAPESARRVFEGFLYLLRCRWLHTPNEPTPFSWRFAAAWCGVSAGAAQRGLRWLVGRGYVKKVGEAPGAYGRGTALFLPGTAEDVAARARKRRKERKEEAR